MPISDSATIRMVDPTALSAGSDFGTRYRIEALLGQGGMGRVYKATDKTLDRVIALKVVRQGMMADQEALNRFKQELLLASKISHTNILRIHDMGEVGDVKFITMAYVEGPDLHHILQETPRLPFERVLNFAQQLASALAAAQSEGVIHRDLKPQNILIGKDDHLYVSDFGLARSFEESAVQMTRTGAFMGTPRYMSPEQVEGKPADLRSDLYAFGLILYEMSTGDVPFTGESTLKVMYQRIQEKPKNPKTLNPDLPNWFVQVIMRCLERDPAVRYQRAEEIVLDLQGAKSTVTTYRGGGHHTHGPNSNPRIYEQAMDLGCRWRGLARGAGLRDSYHAALDPARKGREVRLNHFRRPTACKRTIRGRFAFASPRGRVTARLPGTRYSGSSLDKALSVEGHPRDRHGGSRQGGPKTAFGEDWSVAGRQHGGARDAARLGR